MDSSLDLARDVYGNYIAQHLVVHGTEEDRRALPGAPYQALSGAVQGAVASALGQHGLYRLFLIALVTEVGACSCGMASPHWDDCVQPVSASTAAFLALHHS